VVVQVGLSQPAITPKNLTLGMPAKFRFQVSLRGTLLRIEVGSLNCFRQRVFLP